MSMVPATSAAHAAHTHAHLLNKDHHGPSHSPAGPLNTAPEYTSTQFGIESTPHAAHDGLPIADTAHHTTHHQHMSTVEHGARANSGAKGAGATAASAARSTNTSTMQQLGDSQRVALKVDLAQGTGMLGPKSNSSDGLEIFDTLSSLDFGGSAELGDLMSISSGSGHWGGQTMSSSTNTGASPRGAPSNHHR